MFSSSSFSVCTFQCRTVLKFSQHFLFCKQDIYVWGRGPRYQSCQHSCLKQKIIDLINSLQDWEEHCVEIKKLKIINQSLQSKFRNETNECKKKYYLISCSCNIVTTVSSDFISKNDILVLLFIVLLCTQYLPKEFKVELRQMVRCSSSDLRF